MPASAAISSSVATLGSRPLLPFILETQPAPAYGGDLLHSILDRLDRLQEMSAHSQVELTSLRELNVEILEALTQYLPLRAEKREEAVRAPETSVPPKLTLRLLGPFEARIGDRVVTAWPGRKARLLLAYLAMERGRLVPRDVLIELFWPGAREGRGANNLSIAVHQIRSSIAAILPLTTQAIIVRQGLYGVDSECVSVDLWDLQSTLDAARRALELKDKPAAQAHLRKAINLYKGDLLASDPYEEWTAEPRRILDTASHQALTWLAAEASTRGNWQETLEFASQMLQRDASDEAAHRLAMDAHLKMGNRSQALQQYQLCVETLRRELGVTPSPETRRLAERLAD
ncbi:MAG: hypothetical protein GEU75_07315 [Dehalococcoidia bacterium]|nr:hypothetical protein [Dehalococcoidia bacterium]